MNADGRNYVQRGGVLVNPGEHLGASLPQLLPHFLEFSLGHEMHPIESAIVVVERQILFKIFRRIFSSNNVIFVS
jgi:hypothetical protein